MAAAAAAARTLSRTLFQSKSLSFSSSSSSSGVITTRNLSSKSDGGGGGGGGSLIEVNLETTDNENETVGLKRLEDAIYGIIVRRSAPDWLPFSPGSSYWVPPKKRPHGFAELIGKLTNPLSEDETLSLSNARGWPSTTFFIDGSSSPQPLSPHIVEKEIVVEEPISVDLKNSKEGTKAASQPEDEEV